MQLRWPLAARSASLLSLSLLSLLSLLIAATPTGGWAWTVALVAVVGVLAVAGLSRFVAASAPAVLLRVRRRGHDVPARQSAPGRPGRPRPRAPGTGLRALTPLPAGHPTG